jgi:hypothetical protein
VKEQIAGICIESAGLAISIAWLVPVAIVIWMVVAMNRIKRVQEAMSAKLDTIERRLAGR